jgi:hypothetical protein
MMNSDALITDDADAMQNHRPKLMELLEKEIHNKAKEYYPDLYLTNEAAHMLVNFLHEAMDWCLIEAGMLSKQHNWFETSTRQVCLLLFLCWLINSLSLAFLH